jgi:hypothetical protein
LSSLKIHIKFLNVTIVLHLPKIDAKCIVVFKKIMHNKRINK